MNRIFQIRTKRVAEDVGGWASAGLFAMACSSLAPAALRACGQSPAPRSGVFTDYRDERPDVVHKITLKDLPQPCATKSDGGTESVWRARYAGKSR